MVEEPISAVISMGCLSEPITWLDEEPSFQFLADPFGWRDADGLLHIFAEHYDYRTRHGTIEALVVKRRANGTPYRR
ncbi:hypothetical protein [Sphingobium fuliginis]|uniref:hypothetical protein n=1 Tax=Sphingobium fuliginis (strain ATCC 27551) TaxID=336203 RepID=UPI001FCAF66A|nr:hypothetical protein [Sphingobium fuliginis]